MLKFNYEIDCQAFNGPLEFENYLNAKGQEGKELVCVNITSRSTIIYSFGKHLPKARNIYVVLTWKKETPK